MMLIRQFFLAVALSIVGLSASAQTEETSANLITSGSGHTWTGISITGPLPTDAMPGGPGALYDPNTNTIHFSYGQATVAQTYAINQALANSGSGIQVQGYNYSWDINNLNYDNRQGGTDTLTARVITFDPTGNIRRNDSWTYNTRFDWTTFSGSVNYITPGSPSDFGNLRVEFSGVDSGFWGGYFGPQVRNVDVRLRYTVAPVDPCVSDPQSSPACPGYKTYYNIGDDSYAIVPIPFGYPLYGRVFTHSIFFDNGVVSFYDPVTESARLGGQQYYSQPLSNNIGSNFHYSIMPLWTDLMPDGNTKLYTQSDNTYMKYTWENIQQFGYNNRPNTFSLEIRPSGYLGIQYDKINVEGYPITAGAIGNAALGEWTQHFRSEGTQVLTGGIGSWSIDYTQPTDCSNPLNNPACPGYQQAYFDQQCSANPLYSSSCPGYQQAYFDQQCSINPLYNSQCPGYATAYYDYQCSANALYHTGCPGYATAYFDQQCSLDPLYNEACPGYATAYFDQQCSQDPLYDQKCTGYDDAYYVQQCTASPLYDSGCNGYETAYFNQQCGLDALYNNQCPGYGEAYAKKFILVTTPVAETTVSEPETIVVAQATVAETKEVVAVATATEPAPAPTVSASPAAAATAPVSLVAAPAPAPAAEKKAEAKTETKTETAAAGGSSESKSKPTTTRQALAQRRLEAAREKAAESAKDNPGAVSSQMDSAASMEQQVELQNVVLGAMGFVAGFDAYGRVNLQDAAGYKPFEIYRGQQNVDSAAARGLLGRSDRLHSEMIDSQYNK